MTAHRAERRSVDVVSGDRAYGPMLNAIQDMWDEHDERAQGGCGCSACATAVAFFMAVCECGESKR